LRFFKNQGDLAQNLYAIENLKNRLLFRVANVFHSFYSGDQEKVKDNLSEYIIHGYILGRKAGVSYSAMDKSIEKKAREYLEDKNDKDIANYSAEIKEFLHYRQTLYKK